MFGDVPIGRASGGDGTRLMTANPFQGRVDALSDSEFALLSAAVAARRCREGIGLAAFEDAALEYRQKPRCPSCGGAAKRDDRTLLDCQIWIN